MAVWRLFLDRPSASDPGPPARSTGWCTQAKALVEWITSHGASFFAEIHEALGGGYPGETSWTRCGASCLGRLLTNDAFHSLRAFAANDRRAGAQARPAFGRVAWCRVRLRADGPSCHAQVTSRIASAERMTARARQLLARHGVLTREAVAAEALPGGFRAIYPALKAMDEAGRLRRGYFVAGRGATQFAQPAAIDLLRGSRNASIDAPVSVDVSAVDPANPFGAALPWPAAGMARVAGATVVLVDGTLAAYLPRGERELRVLLPDEEPARSRVGRAVAARLVLGRGSAGIPDAAVSSPRSTISPCSRTRSPRS